MTEPNDRELEQYLKGDSPLSRRYREASGESAPPALDEAILARARAELKRKPNLNRWLAPVALAASLMLGVNLAWNVYQASPVPGQAPAPAESRDDVFVPEPPPPMASAPEARNDAPAPQPERKARVASAPPLKEQFEEQPQMAADSAAALERDADLATRQREQESASLRKAESQQRMATAKQQAPDAARGEVQARGVAPAAAAAPSSLADAAPMSEAQKIDHLINHIGNLAGATFVRNGKDYGATEAAKHLQYKREKAGDRIKTADDFIRLCASHSYLSGEAYLIRFADGRTRTAEDVLREELARISAGG